MSVLMKFYAGRVRARLLASKVPEKEPGKSRKVRRSTDQQKEPSPGERPDSPLLDPENGCK